MSKAKLESGKTYTLNQIFSKDFEIAIPDLQRDYCWGMMTFDKKGNQQGELVKGFLDSLHRQLEECSQEDGFTPMGLIYGYEWPKGTYQLCDGQQRITTFYLLAGELFRRLQLPFLRDILMTDTVMEDQDYSPSLQYSIRESTLYFLSDLVNNYFLKAQNSLPFNSKDDRDKTGKALKLEGRPAWYFGEYDHDPTIQSMLAALHTIQRFLSDGSIDLNRFADAIASKFTFIYYDMGNRLRGEETFVVLNTSGEPLTPTENLKPILIGGIKDITLSKKVSAEWEDREDWFWKNRLPKELTSDNLSREFYTWFLMSVLKKGRDSIDLLKDFQLLPKDSIKKVQDFFLSMMAVIRWVQVNENALTIFDALSRWLKTETQLDRTKPIEWLRLPQNLEIFLPLIMYYNKFGEENLVHCLRLVAKNFYIGKTTGGKDDSDGLRPYVKLNDIIDVINNETEKGVLENEMWFNFDEKRKREVFNEDVTGLVKLETNNRLRFDFNIVWSTGGYSPEGVAKISEKLEMLHCLGRGNIYDDGGLSPLLKNIKFDGSCDNEESYLISLSNQYRLLKYIKGWGAPTGKQEYVNWQQWCVWFNDDSYLTNLDRAYSDTNFTDLLKSEDLGSTIRDILKITINQINVNRPIFSDLTHKHPERMMQAWLIGKFLVNEKRQSIPDIDNHESLISKFNNKSLCVNKEDGDQNIINKNLPVSIGNICLHHVNRNGPWTVGEQYYNSSSALDTPLFIGYLNIDYERFIKGDITKDEVESTDIFIQDLLGSYLNA